MNKILNTLSAKHIFFILGILWTALVVLSLMWNFRQIHNYILSDAKRLGKISIEKDLSYRCWNVMHGGVYVPITEDTPPNPYLSHVHNRDVITSEGMKLTLLNPGYMTRQVDEISRKFYGTKAHITSLDPIRHEHIPDQWEKKALSSFAQGKREAKFDLILCDVILPDMNGIRLCDEFLKIQPGIQIVMMSGYTPETSHIDSIKKKGYGFIQKPFTTKKLFAFIKENLYGV